MSMTDSEKIDVMAARLERMEKLWRELLLQRPTRAQQAKQAKVSRSTLWRRQREVELRELVNGRP